MFRDRKTGSYRNRETVAPQRMTVGETAVRSSLNYWSDDRGLPRKPPVELLRIPKAF